MVMVMYTTEALGMTLAKYVAPKDHKDRRVQLEQMALLETQEPLETVDLLER
jgi:hypothetical protein